MCVGPGTPGIRGGGAGAQCAHPRSRLLYASADLASSRWVCRVARCTGLYLEVQSKRRHLPPHPWGPTPTRTARHRALANEHDDCDYPVTYPAPGHNTGCIPYARGHGQRWPHQLEQRHRHIDMLLLQYHATYEKIGRWDVPVQKSPRWGCQTQNKRGARGTCRCCAALGSWGALCPGNHAEEPCTHLQPMNWPHRLEPCARATPQTKVVPAIPAQKSRGGSASRGRCRLCPQPTHGSG